MSPANSHGSNFLSGAGESVTDESLALYTNKSSDDIRSFTVFDAGI